MCVLCNSNPFVDWHALDPSTMEPAQAGTGDGGSSNGTSVSFNQALVNQLDSGSYWYNAGGTVASTISYGFTTSSAFATGFGEATGWSAFTEAQKTAVRQMMTLWDDLIAPSFVESTGSPNTADIKFSNTTTSISYAHAYYPGQINSEAGAFDKITGSVWLNPAYNSGVNNLVTPTSGVYGYMAILHEIGHSLGLDHGGNYNGGSPQYGNTSTGWLYTEDSRQFTIMSYFNASATGASWGGKYAQTPMVYDIMAIQQMYGADYTTRAGNTIYGFNSNAGNSLYDFSQNTSPILTIWDGNGIDTIDLSGWSSASVLTLTAGSYSSVNGMTKNLAIAYNVDIENATGGSGNDTITGNDLGNVLIGNGGADTINGAGGNDTINGGIGVDILIGGTGDDTIYFDSLDNLTLLDGGVGFDTLIQLGILITFDFAGHNFERLLNIITDLGSAVWSEQTDYYDFAGLYYECDITYDNGTRSVTEYDVYNTETWSEWTVTYAANGDIVSQVFVPDSGSGIAPTITSNGAGAAAAVNVTENSAAVTTVSATDADGGAVLTYSIIGGADATKFAINANTGVLSFVSAPNFEIPTDAGSNNVYDVQVQVSDGALTDTQTIAVTVTNQNETPTITSNGAGTTAAIGVVENNTAVATVTASDPDAGATRTYSIIGGADAAKFTINTTTGVLSFVSAPNFEAAIDVGANNVYDVQVQVSDGALTDAQTIAVTVTNQNEAPAITSNGAGATATVNVVENSTAVTTVTASDPDAGATRTYSIIGGADAAKFTVNASTGVLSFVSAPNFEIPTDAGSNNVYDVQVQVSDGALTDTQTIAVTVTNQNEIPTITSNGAGATAAISIVENSTAVTTVTSTDPDAGATQSYSIIGGADAAKFTINATSGVLSFVSAPNFEAATDAGANNVYDVQVQVSDGALTDTQTIAVTVTNQNEAPAITSNGAGAAAAVNVTENSAAVTTVTATDADAGAVLTYSIIGGADAAKFTISATTGVLSFVSAPNFDAPTDVGANNVYDVQVQVSDGTLTDTQAVAVTVTNDNAPVPPPVPLNVITGNNNRNTLNGTSGDDQINGLGRNDTLKGGAGNDTLNGGSGTDEAVYTGAFGSYTVSYNAATATYTIAGGSDGTDTVTDVEQFQFSDGTKWAWQLLVPAPVSNSAPSITSNGSGATAAISIVENSTAVTTVTSTDPDAGATQSYSIIGGADAAKFTISATTGVLSFVSAPNFDAPTDVGANNVYDVQVQVSDGTLTDTQAVAVTVTNDNAPVPPPVPLNVITGNNNINTLNGTSGDDQINGLGRNDTLKGGAGNDTLNGGTGSDTLNGGLGGDTFFFSDAAFGQDKITDYEDGLDKLSFSLSVADSFDDFEITNNGTNSVTVTHGDDRIIVKSSVIFTLAADDFIFV